ncbi:hypothetical protein [Sulfurospirillum arcachonense]|uniref:hypothetical protein n=1 Tax=Sulfurospirillum arcachonense TaxID=57666 RepID=UPI00046944B6|nr:hypothetical protein [Sulfurospirillum arcachonense]
MLQDVLNDPSFSKEMKRHVKYVLEYLLKKGTNFSILTNVNEIGFEPALPEDISSTFKPITMFVLAGYTFESCVVDDWGISFEAGFGHNNFGSLVSVPLLSVLQIIVDETPILINLSVDTEEAPQEKTKGVKRSMEALLSNPENEKLLK